MADPYTLIRLTDVEDSAPRFGFSDVQEARFANDELETEDTGVSHLRVKAGERQAFAHRHEHAEEVYVVLAGAGRVKLDDEIVELAEWDAVRVPPGTWRGYEAGPAGLELLVIGAPNLGEDPRGDVDGRRGWWSD
jgi:mannose-6-phosphate isomerase-like protein (cupin superfamily)